HGRFGPQRCNDRGGAAMTADYDVGLATPDDIPGILALQEPNLHENGGGLSARQTAEWFRRTMLEMPIIAAHRDGKVVGYVLATSIAARAHVAIVQAMLRTYAPPQDCYLYGPVCVAATERGKGLADALYRALRARLPGRPALTFVRSDNVSSLRAHRKMGMSELGAFTNGGEDYVAFGYGG